MTRLISHWKGLLPLLFAVGCLTCASAAETNIIHVNAQQAQQLVTQKKVVVLDVRTPKEFAGGHIAGATNINFRSPDFAKVISTLDTHKTYLVHCASGGRSTQSLPTFQKLEFKHIYHLDGGIQSWEKAGLPVTK